MFAAGAIPTGLAGWWIGTHAGQPLPRGFEQAPRPGGVAQEDIHLSRAEIPGVDGHILLIIQVQPGEDPVREFPDGSDAAKDVGDGEWIERVGVRRHRGLLVASVR